jgi:hypothetical protein
MVFADHGRGSWLDNQRWSVDAIGAKQPRAIKHAKLLSFDIKEVVDQARAQESLARVPAPGCDRTQSRRRYLSNCLNPQCHDIRRGA